MQVTPRVYNRRERLFWFRLDSRDKEGRRKRKSLHPTCLPIHQTKRKDPRRRWLPGYVNTGTQQIIWKLVLNHFVCFLFSLGWLRIYISVSWKVMWIWPKPNWICVYIREQWRGLEIWDTMNVVLCNHTLNKMWWFLKTFSSKTVIAPEDDKMSVQHISQETNCEKPKWIWL